jgi:hypothetical protein
MDCEVAHTRKKWLLRKAPRERTTRHAKVQQQEHETVLSAARECCEMGAVLYLCFDTGFRVQGRLADEERRAGVRSTRR